MSKKRNLIFEGVPELENGRREDVDKTVCDIIELLSVKKSINFEACYRMGPTSNSYPRAIMVSFERQADWEAIYS